MPRLMIAFIYTAFLALVLIQPSTQPVVGAPAPPGPPSFERELFLTAGHIVGFGLLTAFWAWAFAACSLVKRAAWLAVGLSLSFSLITELTQTLVPDRSASLWDLAVNGAVTLLVAGLILRWNANRGERSPR